MIEKKLISSVEGQLCCYKGNELLWWEDVDSNPIGPAWYVGVGDRALGQWGWGSVGKTYPPQLLRDMLLI